MNVLVIGGKLQGTEITYLAKEAGWHVTVIDRHRDTLASGLCDSFLHDDARNLPSDALSRFDLVIPATENLETLLAVQRLCLDADVPFAFDEAAFRISSSKTATNTLLTQIGVPAPPSLHEAQDWPYGYIVKPDSESGSHGVVRFGRKEDAEAFLLGHANYIGQAFVEGPIYSIEVTCNGSDIHSHCVTEVVVADDFDCFRIVAPVDIPAVDMHTIQTIARRIGLALDMRGIFDVELVWRDGQPYVLEIDARMPSQTPIAIYHATGLNLVVELARCFVHVPTPSCSDEAPASGGDPFPGDAPSPTAIPSTGKAVLEHLCIDIRSIRRTEYAVDSSNVEAINAILEELERFDVRTLVAESHARYVGESQISDALPYTRLDGLLGSERALIASSRDGNQLFATLVFMCEDNDAVSL